MSAAPTKLLFKTALSVESSEEWPWDVIFTIYTLSTMVRHTHIYIGNTLWSHGVTIILYIDICTYRKHHHYDCHTMELQIPTDCLNFQNLIFKFDGFISRNMFFLDQRCELQKLEDLGWYSVEQKTKLRWTQTSKLTMVWGSFGNLTIRDVWST